ncbi:hypothetical protein KO498_13900 [Lentibacter algarum]|uniref:TadE/TadG family type IV pilus assembly protein n=1 Tax=Lentibacter algarum TaxID=576131 RepID=UPI001C091060|nr:hypothetical protein [Lentibacter algarum]MBU2982907.1 hypothetical protein [Lentibacter algarum]
MIWSRIKTRLAAFRDETGGSVSVEFIVMAPIVFWAYASMFSWFDAYRQVGVHEKAAFTIADMITRETDPITPDYIDATRKLVSFLARSSDEADMRISVIQYVERLDQFQLDWSQKRGSMEKLRNSDVKNWHDKLPTMVNGERILLVETKVEYTPPFLYGLMEENTIQTFVFARPRFAPRISYDDNG